jgi:hypothetical protein
MPTAGFEPIIPVSGLLQIRVFDRVAIGSAMVYIDTYEQVV